MIENQPKYAHFEMSSVQNHMDYDNPQDLMDSIYIYNPITHIWWFPKIWIPLNDPFLGIHILGNHMDFEYSDHPQDQKFPKG